MKEQDSGAYEGLYFSLLRSTVSLKDFYERHSDKEFMGKDVEQDLLALVEHYNNLGKKSTQTS